MAALINQKSDLVYRGIRHAQERDRRVTAPILILPHDGHLIAARDRLGRLPVLVGQSEDGCCVSFESFAYHKLGYQSTPTSWAPGEIVRLTAGGLRDHLPPPGEEMKHLRLPVDLLRLPQLQLRGRATWRSCATATARSWPGTRSQKGQLPKVDFVAGVPDSGVPHAIGFANRSGKPFARPFVKYTPTWPRSPLCPPDQGQRNQVAQA